MTTLATKPAIAWRFKLTRKHKTRKTQRKNRVGTLEEAVAAVKDFQSEVTKLTKEKEAYKTVLSNDMTKILTELVKIATAKDFSQKNADTIHDGLFTLQKGVESWKTSIYLLFFGEK